MEPKCKFAPGDIVKLKSGGPKMTVERVCIGPYFDEVSCVWFCQDVFDDGPVYQNNGEPLWGEVFVHAFKAETLERGDD